MKVTQLIKEIDQGGYGFKQGFLPTHLLKPLPLDTWVGGAEMENIDAEIVGTVVDFLVRTINDASPFPTFQGLLYRTQAFRGVEAYEVVQELLGKISGLDNTSIVAACQLCQYDKISGYAGVNATVNLPNTMAIPNTDTIWNIRRMVKRVQKYFEKYGPIVFQGVEVRAPKALGEIDYMTNRELIDLKASSHQPNKTQTFQVLMYYLMAYYSGEPQFRAIQYLTLLNPRRGIAYRVAVNELFAGAVGIVSKGILGFPDSPRDM